MYFLSVAEGAFCLVPSENINSSLHGEILVVKCYPSVSDLLSLACHRATVMRQDGRNGGGTVTLSSCDF